MGSFSIWHWLIVLAIILVLFGGGGKIPRLMKDLGQGVTAFRKGLKDNNKDGEQAQSETSDKQQSVIDRS
ncbi:MAG TPA: twin-arginine translocase TatA/TatE family subunit [Dongiaceae bacterium]